MAVVDIDEAKAQLPRFVDEAATGHDVVIARGGTPVARLTRLRASKTRLKFGVLSGFQPASTSRTNLTQRSWKIYLQNHLST
jgi:prevent-host-death family protein